VTGSLAYRKNEAAILRGDVPKKYTDLLPYIPGDKILEIGSAEGVLALLLAKAGKLVTAIEQSPERHEAAQRLRDAWGMDVNGPRFICGDAIANLGRLEGHDTLVCIRSIYYLGNGLDALFTAAAKHVPNVVLCGNGNRAFRWRNDIAEDTKADNLYASREGMIELLERHGYRIVKEGSVNKGDEVVVGRMG
jgi:hypothetical protein